MTARKRLFSLWPRSIGNQCLLMLPLGLMVGLLWPEAAEMLKPVGRVFLQASQIVVMPFLICELVVGFQGSLEVKQNSVPELVLASPAVPEAP